MNRLDSSLYLEDIRRCTNLDIDWSALNGRSILISGATGMIGACLIDVLMSKNDDPGFECNVIALGRDEAKACDRLPYFDNKSFKFIEYDICTQDRPLDVSCDVVFHLASTTHPVAYAEDPVGTIESNINGLSNLVNCLSNSDTSDGNNLVFASSVEIYGENRGDVEKFKEDYCGYIDCNTLRAGYPESKRTCEALCQAYMTQNGIRPVIARLPRTYGPTLLKSDTKALSQFLKNGFDHENIILKSKGNQQFSYLYVSDVVSALLYCFINGCCGEAYNVADDASDISLKDLATIIADYSGTSVVFDLPSEVERKGFSKAAKAMMDASKIRALGWRPAYNVSKGTGRTIKILKSIDWT